MAGHRDAATLRMVTVTLDRMADGGIHDQLGGGFARYSTDADWLAPHFEKMLYDNALLAHAYLEAHRATGSERYAQVARSTLDFMLAELQTDGGGFAAALDADSEGTEGRFYVWDAAEFASVLADAGLDPAEVRAMADRWDVTPGGNWEGRSILRIAGSPDAAPDLALVERARAALLAKRATRVRPGRDDKQVAAWNGLALRAFSLGALVLADERFVEATRRLRSFIREVVVHDGDRLWRSVRDGVALVPGFAEDYAMVADGLLGAYAALGESDDLRLAEALMGRLAADFWDESSGTLYDTGPEHERERRPSPLAVGWRHARRELGGGGRLAAARAAHRRAGARPTGTADPGGRGNGPRAAAVGLWADAVRRRSSPAPCRGRGGGRPIGRSPVERAAPCGRRAVRTGPGHRRRGPGGRPRGATAVRGQDGPRWRANRLCLPGLRLRRPDHRSHHRQRAGRPPRHLAGQERQPDAPIAAIGVRIQQRNRLPGAERQPTADDRDAERWAREEGEEVVGAMTG